MKRNRKYNESKKPTNQIPVKKRNYWLFEGQSEETLFRNYYKNCPNKTIIEYKYNARIKFNSVSKRKIIQEIEKIANRKINNIANLNKIIIILDLVDIINHQQILENEKTIFIANCHSISVDLTNNIIILITQEQIEDLFKPNLNTNNKPHKDIRAELLVWSENATLTKERFEELINN